MGGINHQPCGRYLENSTRLSRSISSARSYLEQANMALEDVLLEELRGKRGMIAPIKHNLQLSKDQLLITLGNMTALKKQMDEGSYKDLSPLHAADLEATGLALSEAGAVDLRSWEKMLRTMKDGSFYASLAQFVADIQQLIHQTDALFSGVTALYDYALDGTLHKVLEENLKGNIKLSFAQLYQGWAQFQADFLASSLVSTEVWYLHQGHQSLLNRKLPVMS